MIKITEQAEILVPLETVWSYLSSPEKIVECIPGAGLSQNHGDGSYLGTLTISFGPTRVSFQGEVSLDYEPDNYTCRAKARGRDQRGMSNALGTGTFVLSPTSGGTLLAVEGEFELTGPLAPFAKTAGPTVVRALLSDFASNLATVAGTNNVVSADTTTGNGTSPSIPETPAHPLAPKSLPSSMSATKLLGSILKAWWRGLFTRRQT